MERTLLELHGRGKAVAVGAVLVFLTATFVGPRLLAELSLTSGYGWSLLRFGHREVHHVNPTAHWLGATSAWKWSGPAIASAGERLVVDYEVEPDEGKLRLYVHTLTPPYLLTGETVWSHVIDGEEHDRIAIEVPASGFYGIRMSFLGFSGSAEVDWEIR